MVLGWGECPLEGGGFFLTTYRYLLASSRLEVPIWEPSICDQDGSIRSSECILINGIRKCNMLCDDPMYRSNSRLQLPHTRYLPRFS